MYRTKKKKLMKRAGLSAAVAIGVFATGVTISEASTAPKIPHDSSTSGSPSSAPTPPAMGSHCAGGKVTAISASAITVTDPAGNATTYAITASTTFEKNGATSSASAIAVGDNVQITTATSDTSTATVINLTNGAQQPTAQQGDFAGGTVTAVTGTSLTVSGLNNTSTTYNFASSVTVTDGKTTSSVSDIAVGDDVRLTLSSTSATTVTAVDIEPAFAIGEVTAINGNTITVKGMRSGTQTVTVSSATTFTKNGASASLSDITVGSFIFAQGRTTGTSSLNATSVSTGSAPGNPNGPTGGPGGGQPPVGASPQLKNRSK